MDGVFASCVQQTMIPVEASLTKDVASKHNPRKKLPNEPGKFIILINTSKSNEPSKEERKVSYELKSKNSFCSEKLPFSPQTYHDPSSSL